MKEQSSRIVALWSWYHGGAFRGYQSQPLGPTVQDTLITAFRAVGLERDPVASGRTDLGVHARMQVLSMRVPKTEDVEGLPQKINAALPAHVGIAVARAAPPKFNSQWLAETKEYRYRLLLKDDPKWAPYAWRIDVEPNAALEGIARAIGTHDFSPFHEGSSKRIPRRVRRVSLASLEPHVWEIRIVGDGFARYMVRYLVGGTVAAARGEIALADYAAGIDEAKPFAGVKAPASGLVLWEVRYPEDKDPFTGDDRNGPALLPAGPPF